MIRTPNTLHTRASFEQKSLFPALPTQNADQQPAKHSDNTPTLPPVPPSIVLASYHSIRSPTQNGFNQLSVPEFLPEFAGVVQKKTDFGLAALLTQSLPATDYFSLFRRIVFLRFLDPKNSGRC
jgi:hypothetical protein